MSIDLLLITETIENRLQPTYNDLLGVAQELLGYTSGRVRMVIPGQDVRPAAEILSQSTGIDVTIIENEDLRFPNPPLLVSGLRELIKKQRPTHICLLHTMRACHTAAALSLLTKSACITAVEAIRMQDDRPLFRRALFNGKLLIDVAPDTETVVFTILPGSFTPRETTGAVEPGSIDAIAFTQAQRSFEPLGVTRTLDMDNALEEVDVVVSAGRGIGEKDNLELIRDVAGIFENAAIAGSRTVCDMGWLPYGRQVGETGRQIAPKLYMACGISGARQHIAGIKNSQLLIAINTDPRAAIFSVADYGIVEDLTRFLPMLLQKYEERFKPILPPLF